MKKTIIKVIKDNKETIKDYLKEIKNNADNCNELNEQINYLENENYYLNTLF
jgi:hypothetical protein